MEGFQKYFYAKKGNFRYSLHFEGENDGRITSILCVVKGTKAAFWKVFISLTLVKLVLKLWQNKKGRNLSEISNKNDVFLQVAAEKKRHRFWCASQTNFDPSYFVRALVSSFQGGSSAFLLHLTRVVSPSDFSSLT